MVSYTGTQSKGKPTSPHTTFPLKVLSSGDAAVREIFKQNVARKLTHVHATIGLTSDLNMTTPSVLFSDEGFVSVDLLAQSEGVPFQTYLLNLYKESPTLYYDLNHLTYIASVRFSISADGRITKRSLVLYIPVSADHKTMGGHDVTNIYDPSIRQALTEKIISVVLPRVKR